MEFHNTNTSLEKKSYETFIYINEKKRKEKEYLPYFDNKGMWQNIFYVEFLLISIRISTSWLTDSKKCGCHYLYINFCKIQPSFEVLHQSDEEKKQFIIACIK